MQKRVAVINLDKGYIISLILAVIGLVLVVSGLKKYFLIEQSLPINELRFEQCKEGLYVEGEITEYAGKKLVENGRFLGESMTLMAGFKEYRVYTVKILEDKYISVLISDKKLLKKLEEYEQGCGNGAYLEGKIVKSSTGLNYQWLQGAFGTEDTEVIKEKVSSVYEIHQVSFKQEKMLIAYGATLSIIALFIFMASGGVKNFVSYEKVENELEMPQEIKYNLANELEIRKRHLKKLEERQALMKKSVLRRIPFLMLGIMIVLQNYFWEVKLVGIAFLFVFLQAVWRAFINSDMCMARYICGIFGLESLQNQIVECRQEIDWYQKVNESR